MLNYRIIFHFVFLVITGISNFGLSQVDDNDDFDNEPQNYERIKPHHSLSMEVGLPVAMRNSTFNAYMQGMVNISPYYHYSFKNKLTVGAGINYNYFWINHVLTPR